MKKLIYFLLLFPAFIYAQTDTIVLKNNTTVFGHIEEAAAGKIKITVNAEKKSYSLKEVQRLYIADNNKRKQKIIDAFSEYATDLSSQVNLPGGQTTNLPKVDGKIIYTGVVDVPNTSKDELFDRAKIWFVNSYRSANDVLQLDDKANGRLIGKGYFEQYDRTLNVSVYHTISIYVKDNKYKYEITNLNTKFFASGGGIVTGGWVENTLEHWDTKKSSKFIISVNARIQGTISMLEDAMKNANKTSDDW
jgi:hypothetical protein